MFGRKKPPEIDIIPIANVCYAGAVSGNADNCDGPFLYHNVRLPGTGEKVHLCSLHADFVWSVQEALNLMVVR